MIIMILEISITVQVLLIGFGVIKTPWRKDYSDEKIRKIKTRIIIIGFFMVVMDILKFIMMFHHN